MHRHQPTRATKILHVAYMPPSAGFVLPIITRVQQSTNPAVAMRMRDWTAGPLRELGLSLSTKLAILAPVSTRLMQTRLRLLQAIPSGAELAEHLAGGVGWMPSQKLLPFEVLLDIEAFLFEFRSAYEIVVKFLKSFFRDIVGREVTKDEIFEYLGTKGVPIEWVEDLRLHRNIFAHDAPPWIAVAIDHPDQDGRELLILTHPDSDPTSPADCLPFSRLLAIYGGMNSALLAIHDWALREVTALESSMPSPSSPAA